MLLALGLVAAGLTIASFVAQTQKIVRTRKVGDLSTPMWILSTTAFAVWTVYGIALGEWPIVVPNAICFVLAGLILALKLMPASRRRRVADKLTP